MGIVGDVPESGVRIAVERSRVGGPPWVYRGEAVTPASRHAIIATVSIEGDVGVELASGPPAADPPAGLEKRVRLMLRAAWKHASADGAPPPSRIARWRAAE
jgi:hypothetical protein